MAAHILRVLTEFETGLLKPEAVKHALGYAPACDSLTVDHWQALYQACEKDPEAIPTIARRIIPGYLRLYFGLECPASCEAWRSAEFPYLERVNRTRESIVGN